MVPYNATSYDGTNGHYINQGGLVPAFKKMVEVSSKHRNNQGPNWKAVESTAEEYCNINYYFRHGVGLCVQLKQDTFLQDSSQELLGNYSIQGY